jgi:hypothetical protein
MITGHGPDESLVFYIGVGRGVNDLTRKCLLLINKAEGQGPHGLYCQLAGTPVLCRHVTFPTNQSTTRNTFS